MKHYAGLVDMLKETKKKVVLIEDDSDHAELIVDVLHDEDVHNEIVLLKDGQKAVNYFQNRGDSENRLLSSQIDLVLLDINLPKVQGLNVLKLIKSLPEFGSVPIVVLTTSSDSHTIERVYRYGANGYVTKPISYDDFVEKIRMLKEYWLNTEKLLSQKKAKKGRVLLADDDEIFLRVTSALLRREGYECVCATDAETVMENLKSCYYDLLISDIYMPGNEELELIKYLQGVGDVIPAILASGNPSIHSSIQSIQYPVLAYMFKPFAFDKFLAQVKISVERYRGRGEKTKREKPVVL
ncbi:MAG: response regulator [Candidatus Scalindua sp.]|nr:response regulator [Candidatus Scalindua sp.]